MPRTSLVEKKAKITSKIEQLNAHISKLEAQIFNLRSLKSVSSNKQVAGK